MPMNEYDMEVFVLHHSPFFVTIQCRGIKLLNNRQFRGEGDETTFVIDVDVVKGSLQLRSMRLSQAAKRVLDTLDLVCLDHDAGAPVRRYTGAAKGPTPTSIVAIDDLTFVIQLPGIMQRGWLGCFLGTTRVIA